MNIGTFSALGNKPAADQVSSTMPRTVASVDYAIIGSGICALAVARQVLQSAPRARVALVERNNGLASEQTAHNSGVIHSGLFYTPGSSRAIHCVRGHSLMTAYVRDNNLPYKACGKLVVPRTADEIEQMHQLLNRGSMNGVSGLELLSNEQVGALEPNVHAPFGALASHNTGVTDYHAVAQLMASEVRASGQTSIHSRFKVDTIQKHEGSIVVSGYEENQEGPRKQVECQKAVACAGLYSDEVAAAAGDARYDKKVFPFRGRYIALTKSADANKAPSAAVYPVSAGGFLGLHTTPYISTERGEATLLGPGACIAPSKHGYTWSMRNIDMRQLLSNITDRRFLMMTSRSPGRILRQLYTDLSTDAFLHEAQQLLPWLSQKDIEHSFAGVRAQLLDDKGALNDEFVIEPSDSVQGLIHLRNAPSPAATSALSLAEEIARRLFAA